MTVSMIVSSAKSSKLTVARALPAAHGPTATGAGVPVPLLLLEVDLVVGALEESLVPLDVLGSLVFLESLGPLVDFKVGPLVEPLPLPLPDFGLFRSLAIVEEHRNTRRRKKVFIEFIVDDSFLP